MYKLSVVVPIYNVEAYIERCATSLFEQTLSSVEFIFVNDKTPDRSIDILEEISQKFPFRKPHIRIISHTQNLGSAVARISGIKIAQGEYVTFCDSDDWVEPEMYEKMFDRVSGANCDIVYSNYYVEYPHRQICSNLKEVSDIEKYCEMLLYGFIPSFSWIRLYRRNLLLSHLPKLYRDGINMWEDAMMNIMLMPYLKSIIFEPFVGYHYNQCNVNALTKVWSKNARDNVKAVVDLISSSPLGQNDKLRFQLSCFRLNAFYSTASHSNLDELKKMDRTYFAVDAVNIWKHPNMAFLNKLCLVFLYYRIYAFAWGLVRSKRLIKKMVLR